MKILAEGAEAIVYETELGGVPALLKRRMRKAYRAKELDAKIRTERSKNEARIIATVSKAGISAPKLLLFDGYDVYMTVVEGKKLAAIIRSGGHSSAVFESVGETLARLHKAGVVHGDYTPANIIVGKGGPGIIDFGLSDLTFSAEERALDMLLMKRSVAKKSYGYFVKGYKAESGNSAEILARLEAIERRGRYQSRTLS